MYIFISHSSNEAQTAKDLCRIIEENGNECFISYRDIRLGYEYAEEIVNGIDRADVVLLLLSESSNKSPHVLREVERAVTKSVPILVYKMEDVKLTKSMEYFLMTHQWMEAGRDSYNDVVIGINNLKNSTENVKKADKSVNKNKTIGLVAALICVAIMVICFGILGLKNKFGAADKVIDIELGDTIAMGTYNEEDIYWRVLKISEDGTEAVVVTSDVITMKAFDAADSGRYNHDGTENYYFADPDRVLSAELQAYIKGNSSWEASTIRTWLNSASENVDYGGYAPVSSAMADNSNGYNTEKGFLCNFTEEELSSIKDTEVKTKGNILSDSDEIVTTDKVFLLSLDELKWLEEANISIFAVPTQGAIAQDESHHYKNYCLDMGNDKLMWWLREPVEDASYMCYLVGDGNSKENICTWAVGVESFGIRPAMTVDLTSEYIKVVE